MTAHDLLSLGLTNAVLATLLAVAGWLLTRVWKNPHVASTVWLVVLVKLVTPPVVSLPVELPSRQYSGEANHQEHKEHQGGTKEGRVTVPARVSERTERGDVSVVASPPHSSSRVPRPEQPQIAVPTRDDSFIPSQGRRRELADDPIGLATAFPAGMLENSLLAAWLAGSLLAGGVTVLRVVRFRRALGRCAAADESIRHVAERVAERLGLRRCPAVVGVPTNVGPMVWAGGRAPVVVVPRPLWERLGEEERERLLAHELAHVARGDHWVRRAEAVLLALYWWLPTAWVAVRRREAAAESCCDALVLATWPDSPRAYAEALFVAASVLSMSRTPALASGLGRPSELKERLTMIVHNRVPGRPSRPVRFGLALAGAAALLISGRLVQAGPAEPAAGAAAGAAAVTADPLAGESASSAAAPAAAGEPAAAAPSNGATTAADPTASPDAAASAAPAADAGGTRPSDREFGGSSASPFFEPPGRGRMPSGFGGGGRGRGPAPQISDEVREKMIASLLKVIENPNEPDHVKAQALRSLGRIGGGSEQIARMPESAKTYDSLWKLLDDAKDWEMREAVISGLADLGATPNTVEQVRTVAQFAARDLGSELKRSGRFPESLVPLGARFGPPGDERQFPGALTMLQRLAESGDGVRRIVETIRTTEEPIQAPTGSVDTPDGPKSRIEEIYGTETPVRTVLTMVLSEAYPATDDVALALVEALSSDDAEIRQAAAQALGNGGSGVSNPLGRFPGRQ